MTHELVTMPSTKNPGGTYWTCTCGNWHPKASDAPWGGGRAPIDTVLKYIKSTHETHAREAACTPN